MRDQATILVIIPALNEEEAIGKVISAIPAWADEIIVVDNGSRDRTAEIAKAHGARVILEPKLGYGSACFAGVEALGKTDVVVFVDGDFSDHPEEMPLLVDPILKGEADLVIGSRVLGERDRRALSPQARFGNWLACTLMRYLWKISYTDLGPFRAVRHSVLTHLNMEDRNFGWTVEMQIKAARQGLRVREVPVRYRRRIGKSKISGTLKGAIGAGTEILATIFSSAMDSILAKSEEGGVHQRLVLFTRYPEPGKAKTRLIPALGEKGAADLHHWMTVRTLAQARRFLAQKAVSLEVRFEGGTRALMRQWLGPDLAYRPQEDGDLGRRMGYAFLEAFAEGMREVVIIGTDCPGLSGQRLEQAFAEVKRKDLVLGPATDGGYHLIGLSREVPKGEIAQLFSEIAWGTGEVLSQTIKMAEGLGLSIGLLEPLPDVDRPEDLSLWEEREGGVFPPGRISIIIPTLNEAEEIEATLKEAGRGSNLEIIVADGQSGDETQEIARSHGAIVLTTPAGRASQMNAGAALASGDILLFLHADTRLPLGFDARIRQVLVRPGMAGGAFELSIDAPSPSLRMIERLTNWRSRRLKLPYGDQGIFIRADVFWGLGGFPDMAIMEDFEMARRVGRRGGIAIIPEPAITSARRWMTLGIWRTTLINQMVVAAYYLGISPSRIARWSRRKGDRSPRPDGHSGDSTSL